MAGRAAGKISRPQVGLQGVLSASGIDSGWTTGKQEVGTDKRPLLIESGVNFLDSRPSETYPDKLVRNKRAAL